MPCIFGRAGFGGEGMVADKMVCMSPDSSGLTDVSSVCCQGSDFLGPQKKPSKTTHISSTSCEWDVEM